MTDREHVELLEAMLRANPRNRKQREYLRKALEWYRRRVK